MTSAVRSWRDGVFKIKDGAGTPAVITVLSMAGGLECQTKNAPFAPIKHRGTITQIANLDDELLDFSFTLDFNEFYGSTTSGFANLTPFEALQGANNNSTTITSTGIAGEPTTLTLELTITNPESGGTPATEVLTLTKARVEQVTFKEAVPANQLVFSGKARSCTIAVT